MTEEVVITDNSVEKISVIFEEERVSIRQETKGRFPDRKPDHKYNVVPLNWREALVLREKIGEWQKLRKLKNPL